MIAVLGLFSKRGRLDHAIRTLLGLTTDQKFNITNMDRQTASGQRFILIKAVFAERLRTFNMHCKRPLIVHFV